MLASIPSLRAALAIVLVAACTSSAPPAMSGPEPAEAAAPPTAPPEPDAGPPPQPEPARLEPRVVLVTVDGVRWQDVFAGADAAMLHGRSPIPDVPAADLARPEGLLPRTWALVERSGIALGKGGERGAPCGVVKPRNGTNISLPGYHEIFTGHGTRCMSNVCPSVESPTVLDAAAAAGLEAASVSSWEAIALTASKGRIGGRGEALPPKDVFVSAGTHWPASARPIADARLAAAVAEGERARPFPAYGGTYRPDRYTIPVALAYLRARRPRLLHVGLGDADEYGHRNDYPSYLVALRGFDRFLGELVATLEELDLASATTVLVTADHGRAAGFRDHGPRWPESARSWVIGLGGPIVKRGVVCAKNDLWLTDIAPTVRALLGLPRDTTKGAVGKPIAELLGR